MSKIVDKSSAVKKPVGAPSLYTEIRRATISMETSTHDEITALPGSGVRTFSKQVNRAIAFFLGVQDVWEELIDAGDGDAVRGVLAALRSYRWYGSP